MDAGREALLTERKTLRSKLLNIIFPTNDNNFQILDDDGNVKYNGIVQGQTPHKDDFCSCPNFKPLNTDIYVAEHGHAYQCKHLIGARKQKFGVDT